ncbi:MAG: hypothetical protein HQL10_12270 [Nitrospirae bacterium]|nr:hypothetical protein [Nitrospirota bacterium]
MNTQNEALCPSERMSENCSCVIPLKSIQEALLLLEYAARQGKDLDNEVVTVITQSKSRMHSNDWSAEFEAKFWKAFNKIAKDVQPVNVDSLKATSALFNVSSPFLNRFLRKRNISVAENAVTRYRRRTFVFLAFLVIVQVLWFYGTSIVSEINQILPKIDNVSMEIQKKKSEKFAKGSKTIADNPEISRLEGKREEYTTKYDANFTALQDWDDIIRLRMFVRQTDNKTGSEKSPLERLTKKQQQQIKYLQNAQYILQVMQLYILPLLYGFVGACAYILRTLSSEIKNITYTEVSDVGYLLRLQLGALAGLAIGWFASPETFSVVKNISPFALAFLAGYSVELLFTVMDRIIAAFSFKEAQAK